MNISHTELDAAVTAGVLRQGQLEPLLALVMFYALFSVLVAIWFEQRGHGVLAGIFVTLAIALTPLLIGFALIGVGIWWNKHERQIAQQLSRYFSKSLRELASAGQS